MCWFWWGHLKAFLFDTRATMIYMWIKEKNIYINIHFYIRSKKRAIIICTADLSECLHIKTVKYGRPLFCRAGRRGDGFESTQRYFQKGLWIVVIIISNDCHRVRAESQREERTEESHVIISGFLTNDMTANGWRQRRWKRGAVCAQKPSSVFLRIK